MSRENYDPSYGREVCITPDCGQLTMDDYAELESLASAKPDLSMMEQEQQSSKSS